MEPCGHKGERSDARPHITFLAGATCAGRLPGSPGALAAARYIERELAAFGLAVHLQEVPLTSGYWSQDPHVYSGRLSFAYRHDFKEIRLAGSRPGLVSGPLSVLTPDTRGRDVPNGSVLLLVHPPTAIDLPRTLALAAEHGAQALLLGGGRGPFLAKGGGAWPSKAGLVAAQLTSEAAEALSTATNEPTSLSLPYRYEQVRSSNVIGLLRGTKTARNTLLLVAHYDHVGDDPGWRYPGALDNASGVGLLLAALPKILARWPPALGLVALFTTGEEMGLRGARAYTEDPIVPLARTSVLNIDTVGLEPRRSGIAVGPRDDGGRLGAVLGAALAAQGIDVQYLDLPTDRRAFVGLAAEVADFSEAHGPVRVHHPDDRPEGISALALQLLDQALVEAALNWANSH